jgi:hypothetical protein
MSSGAENQRTSQILCLPSSHSFQAYGSKPMRGHVMGKTKSGEASNGATYPDVALTPCKVTAGLKIPSPAVQQSHPGQD